MEEKKKEELKSEELKKEDLKTEDKKKEDKKKDEIKKENKKKEDKKKQENKKDSKKKEETKKENNMITRWKIISAVLAAALIVLSFSWAISANQSKKTTKSSKITVSETGTQPGSQSSEADALSLWKDDSALKSELINYVTSVTNKSSGEFIPERYRVAVFDMDGTLCCETDPGYFDHQLLYYRVMEDPDYKNKASKEEKETAKIIKKYFDTGEYPGGLDIKHGKAVASAFKGMTPEEFDSYVKVFKNKAAAGYEGMTIGEAFYKPMLQVVNYLKDNDFRVYIVSGTDRLITRGLAEEMIDIPVSQMIGSDESLVASHQGDKDGLEYTFTSEDKIITGGEFLIKNLKMNKVSVIQQEIGVQPVLAFGNSSGDAAMANFVINNNKFRAAAFMLCCDDLKRENGNKEKADKMKTMCNENGWISVSMKDDWTTIYGDEVTKK